MMWPSALEIGAIDFAFAAGHRGIAISLVADMFAEFNRPSCQ
jgi:hypothetical protein